MGWVKSSRNGEAVFDVYSYPMPESQPRIKVSRNVSVPFRDIPKEEAGSRLQQPNTLVSPTLAPLQILPMIEIIIDT